MKNELSIRIKICDRIYPMKVKRELEASIRESAKVVNNKASGYKNHFGTNDNQDILAIIAFESILELIKIRISKDLSSVMLLLVTLYLIRCGLERSYEVKT